MSAAAPAQGETDHFCLPDTLAQWPYPRLINPHYEEVKAESMAWQESFRAFAEKKQKAFNSCDFNLLAALAYPQMNQEHLRTCADLLNFIFTFDELSDVEDERGVEAQRAAIMDAFRNPSLARPKGEMILGEMVRDLWTRALPTTPEHVARRFVETFDPYTAAVVQEAEDRRVGHVRGIRSYLAVRRGTVGVVPLLTLYALELDMDGAAFEQMVARDDIAELEHLAVDMSILGNDMVSYIMERDMGHFAHNIITVAMRELHTDVHGALRWLAEEHACLVARFLALRDGLADGGASDAVQRYVSGLANWVRAIDCWFFECERFFGERGQLVQRERWADAGLASESKSS